MVCEKPAFRRVFLCYQLQGTYTFLMETEFSKYHALGNDFLVVEYPTRRPPKSKMVRLAECICDRRTGVGADGILCISPGKKTGLRLDIFNADGSWAEKSGNGLRIAGLHLHRRDRRRRSFEFETGSSVDHVEIVRRRRTDYLVRSELAPPKFACSEVPVKSKRSYMINTPLRVGNVSLPVTCLSVGNPHTVLFVDNLDFDWPTLGLEIEHLKCFSNRTNVEFVKILTHRKLRLADWERGAGATGSSGTGAAAAVVAAVVNGQTDRKCEVIFDSGSMQVNWRQSDDRIELTGPVNFICSGKYGAR